MSALADPDLHATLLTLDSHIDIPWPEPPDPFGPTSRRVDFSKMARGGLRAGCFAAYVPQGPRTPEGLGTARGGGRVDMLITIRAMAREQNGLRAAVASTADAIREAAATGASVVIPAVENGHVLGEDVGGLARLRELGARYLTLTHKWP